ncbi:putative Amidohydrolase [Seiridium cardinale]
MALITPDSHLRAALKVGYKNALAMSQSLGHIFVNGKVLLNEIHPGLDTEPRFADALYIRDGIIQHVGSQDDSTIVAARAAGAAVRDLKGRTLLPGFIDGHVHLLWLGQALKKVGLDHCEGLDDIRKAIKHYAIANPDEPQILCKGWMRYMSKPLATLVDDLDPRPIYIDSKGLHTRQCNHAGLKELDADNLTAPEGGFTERVADGKATGAFSEAAVFSIIWPFLVNTATKVQQEAWIYAAADS